MAWMEEMAQTARIAPLAWMAQMAWMAPITHECSSPPGVARIAWGLGWRGWHGKPGWHDSFGWRG
eukprot:8986273-Alexandrium_andersonii.AAC.1